MASVTLTLPWGTGTKHKVILCGFMWHPSSCMITHANCKLKPESMREPVAMQYNKHN